MGLLDWLNTKVAGFGVPATFFEILTITVKPARANRA